MFIGVSAGCITLFERPAGGTVSTALVGYTTDGTYPAGTTTGDVVIFSGSDVNPLGLPVGFTQIGSGAIGAWGFYAAYQRTAPSALSGNILTGIAGMVAITLRGVSAGTLISAYNAGSTWANLSGLTNNSNVYAVGFTDNGAGGHGGATLSGDFTTQTNASRQVLATKTTLNSGTTYNFTGCSNTGTNAVCFSYGIA
jgi:hypothetical protein